MVLNPCLVGNIAPSPWDPGAPIQSLLGSKVWESRRKRHREIVAEREKETEMSRESDNWRGHASTDTPPTEKRNSCFEVIFQQS